jgi:hypothetical protein
MKRTINEQNELFGFDEDCPNDDPIKKYDLTISEAVQAMKNGRKVAHPYFTSDEYIFMIDDHIFDENGYDLGTIGEFMSIRTKMTEHWYIKY